MRTHKRLLKLVTVAGIAMATASAVLSAKSALAIEIAQIPSSVSVGTWDEGYELGLRNGGLIAKRVYKKVIWRQGCEGLSEFQYALSSVTSRVKPPQGRGTKFSAGFYQGYVDAVRKAIRNARYECGVRRFSDGSFPGQFYANVLCQVATDTPDALEDIRFAGIYDGWSADQDVRDTCQSTFAAVAGECVAVSGIAQQLLLAAQAASCGEAAL